VGPIQVDELCDDVDELRKTVAIFIETYNNGQLVERPGHRTPREAFTEAGLPRVSLSGSQLNVQQTPGTS
jgi:hypothetical protein